MVTCWGQYQDLHNSRPRGCFSLHVVSFYDIIIVHQIIFPSHKDRYRETKHDWIFCEIWCFMILDGLSIDVEQLFCQLVDRQTGVQALWGQPPPLGQWWGTPQRGSWHLGHWERLIQPLCFIFQYWCPHVSEFHSCMFFPPTLSTAHFRVYMQTWNIGLDLGLLMGANNGKWQIHRVGISKQTASMFRQAERSECHCEMWTVL